MAFLAVVYILYLSARWSGYVEDDMPWMADTGQRTVFVGSTGLTVPASMLRVPVQGLFPMHKGTSQEVLQLAVTWPSMTGFRADTRQDARLGDFGRGTNLVLLDIRTSGDRDNMRNRLKPVYKRLARGTETAGPAGLRILTLSAPKDNLDQIVYEPGNDQNGFIARCRKAAGKAAQICSSQKRFGDTLTIAYRFERRLLANWGLLERRVTDLVQAMAQKETAR